MVACDGVVSGTCAQARRKTTPWRARISRFGVRPRFDPRNPMRSARVVSSVIRMMLAGAAKLATELRYDERIYEADALRLLEVISQIEENFNSVLLVGHNPGMEELLELLTGCSEHMSTATLAQIYLKGVDKWSKVSQGKATLELIVKPKQIS